MSYTVTVGPYSASSVNAEMAIYEEDPSFKDGVNVEESFITNGGVWEGVPDLDGSGPFDMDIFFSRGHENLWTEPLLSEVLEELPALPNPRFWLRWIGSTGIVEVGGPITTVTVPEPSAELLRAWATLASVGLAFLIRKSGSVRLAWRRSGL